jgi:hypothetical protein
MKSEDFVHTHRIYYVDEHGRKHYYEPCSEMVAIDWASRAQVWWPERKFYIEKIGGKDGAGGTSQG